MWKWKRERRDNGSMGGWNEILPTRGEFEFRNNLIPTGRAPPLLPDKDGRTDGGDGGKGRPKRMCPNVPMLCLVAAHKIWYYSVRYKLTCSEFIAHDFELKRKAMMLGFVPTLSMVWRYPYLQLHDFRIGVTA